MHCTRQDPTTYAHCSKIAREEGILGWWRGCTPTVARAMALNVGMLATYDQTKEILTAKIGAGSVWLGFSFLSLYYSPLTFRWNYVVRPNDD